LGTWGEPFDPALVGREFYLCCNMGFNAAREAADSNYGQYWVGAHKYNAGPKLAAGTRVTVTQVGASGVAFRAEGSEDTYTLSHYYGRPGQSAKAYFIDVLRERDPMDGLREPPPEIAAAMRDGLLVKDMTKEEALIARGYPPAHKTPNLTGNEWIYYDTPGFVDRVVFVDGRIASVTRGPAPE
jgi:hypothetical protein